MMPSLSGPIGCVPAMSLSISTIMRFERVSFLFFGRDLHDLAFSVCLRVVVSLCDGCCEGIDGLTSIFSSGISDFIPPVPLFLPQVNHCR